MTLMPVLECGPVALRPATAEDDDTLVRILPDDFEHDPTFPSVPGRTLTEHREAWLRAWLHAFRHPDPADVFHVFVVEWQGRAVVLQTLEGERFADTRAVETTSFLHPDARGRRLGVAMRRAVLDAAFTEMGAHVAYTSADPTCRAPA